MKVSHLAVRYKSLNHTGYLSPDGDLNGLIHAERFPDDESGNAVALRMIEKFCEAKELDPAYCSLVRITTIVEERVIS
jgi:hypothetical protein